MPIIYARRLAAGDRAITVWRLSDCLVDFPICHCVDTGEDNGNPYHDFPISSLPLAMQGLVETIGALPLAIMRDNMRPNRLGV